MTHACRDRDTVDCKKKKKTDGDVVKLSRETSTMTLFNRFPSRVISDPEKTETAHGQQTATGLGGRSDGLGGRFFLVVRLVVVGHSHRHGDVGVGEQVQSAESRGHQKVRDRGVVGQTRQRRSPGRRRIQGNDDNPFFEGGGHNPVALKG